METPVALSNGLTSTGWFGDTFAGIRIKLDVIEEPTGATLYITLSSIVFPPVASNVLAVASKLTVVPPGVNKSIDKQQLESNTLVKKPDFFMDLKTQG